MSKRIAKCDTVKPGDIFGELTIIEEDTKKRIDNIFQGKSNHKWFKCQCSCGKIVSVDVYQLLNGITRSCGHLKRLGNWDVHKDITNMTFGHLHTLYVDENNSGGNGKHTYWICQCDLCGNEVTVRSSDLISGYKTDCGCLSARRISDGVAKDLNGQTFGHLHVISRDYGNIKRGGGHHARWLCECDLCGRIESVNSQMLLHYGKDRCKVCSKISMGELKIRELLESISANFIHDKPYMECKFPDTGGCPRFDFIINPYTENHYIIEFDGAQHYHYVPMYNDRYSFEDRQRMDDFKTQWCSENNIPLIRIPYTRLKKISLEDILLETSKYIVK